MLLLISLEFLIVVYLINLLSHTHTHTTSIIVYIYIVGRCMKIQLKKTQTHTNKYSIEGGWSKPNGGFKPKGTLFSHIYINQI